MCFRKCFCNAIQPISKCILVLSHFNYKERFLVSLDVNGVWFIDKHYTSVSASNDADENGKQNIKSFTYFGVDVILLCGFYCGKTFPIFSLDDRKSSEIDHVHNDGKMIECLLINKT